MPGADTRQQMPRLPRLLGQDQHQHVISRSLRVNMSNSLFQRYDMVLSRKGQSHPLVRAWWRRMHLMYPDTVRRAYA